MVFYGHLCKTCCFYPMAGALSWWLELNHKWMPQNGTIASPI